MAQTSTAVDSTLAEVEVSANGSSWSKMSGSLVSVTPGEQTRNTGQINTIDGDKPIVRKGKMGTLTITLRGVYTHTSGEIFETLRAIWETTGGGDVYLRYYLADDTAGEQMFSTGKAILSSLTYPAVSAEDANPIAFQANILASGLTVSTVASS